VKKLLSTAAVLSIALLAFHFASGLTAAESALPAPRQNAAQPAPAQSPELQKAKADLATQSPIRFALPSQVP
jgi:hypothetical protein